jgi:hypothetical protein
MAQLLELLPLVAVFVVVMVILVAARVRAASRAVRMVKPHPSLELHKPSRFNDPWFG